MNVKVFGRFSRNIYEGCVLLNEGNIALNRNIKRTNLLHT